MAVNHKFYYLKLKEDFFERDDIKILENGEDGPEYVLLYIKLCLRSLKGDGALVVNEICPMDVKMLASICDTSEAFMGKALELFQKLGLIIVNEDNVFYLPDISWMTGLSSTEGERKAKARAMLRTDSGQSADKCPPENRDKRIENRDKIFLLPPGEEVPSSRDNLAKEEKPKQKAGRYGPYKNVCLSDEEYKDLQARYPSEYENMIDKISYYMSSTGKTYKNHLATMLMWKEKDNRSSPETKKERYRYGENRKS